MTPRTPTRQRFAAWFSLAAMLLLVLGAPIGQTSAAIEASGDMAAAAANAMHHSAGVSHAADAAGDVAEDASGPGLHDQCGYCSLFSHCPAVAQAELGATLDGSPPPTASRQRVRDANAVATTFPNALTRAPPHSLDRS